MTVKISLYQNFHYLRLCLQDVLTAERVVLVVSATTLVNINIVMFSQQVMCEVNAVNVIRNLWRVLDRVMSQVSCSGSRDNGGDRKSVSFGHVLNININIT